MNNFKKIFALILTGLTVAFGVIALIADQPLVGIDALKALKFDTQDNIGIAILTILYLAIDISLIAAPAILVLVVAFNKVEPYKGIETSAFVVLLYFVARIFVFLLLMIVWKAPADVWKAYMFDKETLGIIPTLVFFFAFVLLIASSSKKLDGQIARAILVTISSALAIFGVVFYYVCGNGASILMPSLDKTSWSDVVAIAFGAFLFGGLVAYTFLPQTRSYKSEE